MFGVPGALGCAIGNLLADIASGYSLYVSIPGFAAQFVYGFLPWFIWKAIRRRNPNEPRLFRLNNVKNVIRYILIILVNAIVMAALIGMIMQFTGINPFLSMATLMVFLNNFVFGMVLGIPVLVFLSLIKQKAGIKQKTSNKGITLNERLILFLLLTGIVSAFLIGVFSYMELSRVIEDPLLMWNRIYAYISVYLFVFCFLIIAILRYSERNITIPIESIAEIAKNYVSGDKIKDSELIASQCESLIKNRSETGILAEAFKMMILDLEEYIGNLQTITAEKERISAELDVAARIQSSMLPCVFPLFAARKEFGLHASMNPAKEVGGDFYDFFMIDKDTLAVVIADVSGKGIPAALFMVIAKTLIKNNAQSGKSPAEVFETANNLLCENNEAGMFVTAILGYLDLPSGKFSFVNAGHNPPLLRSAAHSDGHFDWLRVKPGLVLAGLEDMAYQQHEVVLNPGDEVFLYTDGITEAANDEKMLFGNSRLLETANNNLGLPPSELAASIKSEVDKFEKGAEQADDVTMLVLRYKGSAANELTVDAALANMDKVLDFVNERLAGYSPKILNKIGIIVDEVFSNIARYAYSPLNGTVTIRVASGDEITIEFEDSGTAYNPLAAKAPDIIKPAEEREAGGLGIFIMKNISDTAEYRRENDKNILTVKINNPTCF
jgi:sigma-B regulation protein RsbU (phosphoserine phosphatase)